VTHRLSRIAAVVAIVAATVAGDATAARTAAPVPARPFVAFGPESFVRATGAPKRVFRSFTVLNPDAPYTLRADNGGADGRSGRVTSAVVSVNGVEVMRPSDFKKKVAVITKAVKLATDNTLAVELRGKPGSTLSLQVIGIDSDLPTISAAVDPAPAPDGSHSSDVTVSFTCSDETSGIATCPAPVVVTTEGANQVVSGTAVDRAGHEAAVSVVLNISKLFGMTSASPADGEEMVNVTREAVINFSSAIDAATITDQSLRVVALGQTVSGRRVVSSTRRFVTFFPDNPWPASTEVLVEIDGNLIRSSAGAQLDGDGDRTPGGVGRLSFTTLPLTRIPRTNVFGFVKDSYTGQPIVGATIRVDAFPEANVVTDENGRFELKDMPAPEFFVHIDGSTSTGAPPGFVYPSVGKPFHSVPGQTVQLTMDGAPFDVFLPPMAMGDVVELSPTVATDVGFGPAGVDELKRLFPNVDPAAWARMTVEFGANSAVDEFGNPATQAILVPVPPDRLPAPLPPGADAKLVISIQALGATNFDVPAPVTFPNLDGLAPGEKSVLMSFNHDAGRWESIGMGTVSADGLSIVSDPGVGIRAPGWHFTIPGSQGNGSGDNNPDDFDPKKSPSHARLLKLSELTGLPPEVIAALAAAGAKLQPISGGRGDYVYDDYNVTIDRMPPGVSPEAFLREMATDLNGTVNDGGFDFINEFNRRGSGPPTLGEIWDIDILGPDDGSVVLSQSASDHFVFTTIETPQTASHPEFGSREFGFQRNADGSVTFYTRGASRPRDIGVDLFGDLPQAAGWARLMRGISDELDRRGGRARPNSFKSTRHDVANAPDPPAPLRFFYRIQYVDLDNANGSVRELSGVTLNSGAFSAILPAGVYYLIHLYNPVTKLHGSAAGQTSRAGPTDFGVVHTVSPEYVDSDGDELGDFGESVIGTNPARPDSDGDGITDAAEIDRGLNPLDNRGFPTGVISTLPLPAAAQGVAVQDDTIFAATGSHGLAIVDGTRFDNPIMLGQIDLPGSASDVGIDASSGLAVVATGQTLELVDVTDRMAPTVQRSVPVAADLVEVFAGFAYAASVTSISVVDLGTGQVVHQVTVPGSGRVTGLARQRDKLYAYVSGSDILAVVDIAEPEAAALAGRLNVSIASSDVGVFVGNDVAWLAGSGLRTVDVSDATSPRLIHGADSFFSARRIALNGSGLGLVTPDGGSSLEVYDVSTPARTAAFLTRFALSGAARDAAISRGIGYVAAGNQLEVVNYRSFDANGQPPTVTISASVADVDPGAPGLQVLEGGPVTVSADVSDDVQVGTVALLLDGNVSATDVSYPFDFAAVAVGSDPSASALNVQVRATDTGGNTGLSNTIVIDVVPDTFPPTVERIDPAAGDVRGQGHNAITIRFSEPIKPAGVNGDTFKLVEAGPNGSFGDGDDVAVPVTSFLLRDDDTLVRLTTDPLAVGAFQLHIDRAGISDRKGNVMGAGILTSDFTIVEFVPVTITFDAGRGFPFSYTENELTVASGQDHLHMGDQNRDGSPDLLNHSSCCSTPYIFTFSGGAPFSVLSFDVVGGSAITSSTLTSSNGGVVTPTSTGTVTLSGAAWTNITSFSWDQPDGDMIIDNLVISAVAGASPPSPG